jgi:hypothetical protein
LFSTNQTTTNIVATAISAGTIVGTTLSTANVYASLGTVSNFVGTTLSSSNLVATTSTIPNIIHTNMTVNSIFVTSGGLGVGSTAPSNAFVLGSATQNINLSMSSNFGQYSSIEAFDRNNPSQKRSIALNAFGGNVGIGTTAPAYKLQLDTDSAAKPSTNTWTIASDERLKTNIQLADLDTCYNLVKNLPLKRYTWRDDVYTVEQVPDRSKLGWIAQDVEGVMPKAVERKEMFGYEDCRTLNSDQLIASLYGAVQKIIQIMENQAN